VDTAELGLPRSKGNVSVGWSTAIIPMKNAIPLNGFIPIFSLFFI
jgi:hypothetical protein